MSSRLDVLLVLLLVLPPRPTAAQYADVSSGGTCEGSGYITITTAEACRAAAHAICGEATPTDLMGSNSYSGCITTSACSSFWFKSDSESPAGGCGGDNVGYKCLCDNAGGQTSAASCDVTALTPPRFATRGNASQAGTARFVCDVDDTQSITYTCGAGGTFATTDAACPVPNIPCDGTLLGNSPLEFSTRGAGAESAGGTASAPVLTATEAFGATIRRLR